MKIDFYIAVTQLSTAIVMGILTVYLTKVIVTKYYKAKTGQVNPYQNTSFMIFLAGTILSVSYMVYGINEPLAETMRILQSKDLSKFKQILEYLRFAGMFLTLAYAFSAGVIFLAYKLFSILTSQLDEFDEISRNNIGVAILVSVLTFVIALFAHIAFIGFIQTFIPYPEMPNFI
jgi:hypothetical protein